MKKPIKVRAWVLNGFPWTLGEDGPGQYEVFKTRDVARRECKKLEMGGIYPVPVLIVSAADFEVVEKKKKGKR